MRQTASSRLLRRTTVIPHAGPSRPLSTTVRRHAADSDRPSRPAEVEEWQPVLPAGQNAAYDAALSYLHEHRQNLLSRIENLRSEPKSEEVRALLEKLEVEADVNHPPVRRSFRQTGGKGQMDKPVMRYLAERKWKKEGGLDLLMQRVETLKVVPDVVPRLGSTNPLFLVFTGATPSEEVKGLSADGTVEPGSVQGVSTLSNPPQLHLQLLHHPPTADGQPETPEGLYTLLVLDPDSPNHETQSYATRLHYAKRDIPLSVLSGEVDLMSSAAGGREIVGWEPPAPAKGSGTHRYIFAVLQQSSSSAEAVTLDRDAFDLREYLSANGSTADDIVGLTLFRAKWTVAEDEHIKTVWKEHRGQDMPEYGKPPKEMRYGYPMSAKAIQREEEQQELLERAVAGLTYAGLNEVEAAEAEEREGRLVI